MPKQLADPSAAKNAIGWIENKNKHTLDDAGIERRSNSLDAQNDQRQILKGRYRGLLEAAPDAMVVVNQDREIVLLNVQAEKQFGYDRDELVGQTVKNIIPEGFAERLIADGTRSAADALAQQIDTGIELSGRRKDGSEFPIEIMLSPLESREGNLVTAAIRDISVRKAAEKHLAQLEQPYSVVVIDRCMPVMDGFEAAAEIRRIAGRLPTVMLTSDARPGDSARRAEARLSGYRVSGVHPKR